MPLSRQESVPSVLETAATGETADIFTDIRKTLGTSVVNLIWRNLATMPGALRWGWTTVKPLYMGLATEHAEAVRRTPTLPHTPDFSIDALMACRAGPPTLTGIRKILDSHYHTNALTLVVLSALLERRVLRVQKYPATIIA
jgi:hypothetical protein